MPAVRVVYFGTPAYAVPALEALASNVRFEVTLVVTQPDRPAGRGHHLSPPPVKIAAERLGVPVYQPQNLRTAEARQPLLDAGADLFVVAAFGLIFGEKTLAIPKRGAVNLHASTLPAYRGASPIAAAILNGDEAAGVSLMVMERGLDTGPVIAERSIRIEATDTTETLTPRLGQLGADLLLERIGDYLNGSSQPVPQDDDHASFARPLRKADGEIDWDRSAAEIERHARAMWPWPRAWSILNGQAVQIHRAAIVNGHDSLAAARPGNILDNEGELHVACGEGGLRLEVIQFPGKGPISGGEAIARKLLGDGDWFDSAPDDREPIVNPVTSGSSTSV